MKHLNVILLSFFTLSTSLFAQSIQEEIKKKGEAKILIDTAIIKDIQTLANTISLDYIVDDYLLGYVNENQYNNFLELGLEHKIFKEKSIKNLTMAMTKEEMNSWDKYPTYSTYLQMMNDFAERYPELCSIDTIGYSVNNRLLLSLVIKKSDDKPKFFYSSTIHGDELLGYVMMLRLSSWLLENYNIDQRATDIINNTQIYICPLANPDGTYAEDDNSVSYCKRSNANNYDLNRNFPDPVKGDYPYGDPRQKETEAFMEYGQKNNFYISSNIHSGAEVLNFPYDCWLPSQKRHPDSLWFKIVCRSFVDSLSKLAPDYYFKDVSPNGYTYGADWYLVYGGRQDYFTYFHNHREITLEITRVKKVDASLLNTYWEYLHNSFLTLIEFAQKSIEQVGISDINSIDDTKMTIYPNPSKDYINVLLLSGDKINFAKNYKIYNPLGILIQRGPFDTKIDIHNLTKGLYILEVNNYKKIFIKD